MVTYNPVAAVFGYWRMDFQWLRGGTIEARHKVLVGHLQLVTCSSSLLHLLHAYHAATCPH